MMNKSYLTGLVLSLCCSLAAAVPVTSSTSSYMTFRSCTTTVTTVCDGITPVEFDALNGLPGNTSSAASLTRVDYGSATGSAQLTGGVGGATLTGTAESLAAKRSNSNTVALQRYTYNGTSAATLTFGGLLTVDQRVPTENAGFDPSNAAAVFSGAFASLEIFMLGGTDIEAGTTAEDNYNMLLGGYTLAPGYVSIATTNTGDLSNVTGSGSSALSLSVGLNPGESVWLYALMQTPAVNGAYVNANFVTSASVVPEPATVTLLALGLAGLAATRRRKQ